MHSLNNQFLIFSLITLLGITLTIANKHHNNHNNHHGASVSDISKGLAGWVQSYKEPKTDEEKELKVNSENSSTKHKESERSAPVEEEEEEEEEEPTCTIKVQKVEKHVGKCVRLRGSVGACQTDKYLDPQNAECMFL
uniref:Uncharacterized protein n=2 Tax=Meloidogyne TaxID=189290 RepID=A0A6V7VS03_MELEN|nr:unnamed protein product [Meloidogyne enterolobii]